LQDVKPIEKYAPLPGSFKQISIGGSPALQYEYSFSDTQVGFERYYCADQKLYVFNVVYPANQPRPRDSDRIFKFIPINPGRFQACGTSGSTPA
jgi:hypothetical protein